MLKRSHDRKVTNLSDRQGKKSAIANAFGLPAGLDYSCPGATAICLAICYAGKLEKLFPNARRLLLHNWELLRNATVPEMARLISDMMLEFVQECDKKNARKIFRIHWDGDFFSPDYTSAWEHIISAFPEVTFWAYTRVPSAAEYLRDHNLPNLSLYFSADRENWQNIPDGVKVAYLDDTFDKGRNVMKFLTGKNGIACPEQTGRYSLITNKGGACSTCNLCITGDNQIRFSITKK